MPFINKREATKRPKDRKINGKLTNGTNRRSRVWPVYFIYHHKIDPFLSSFSSFGPIVVIGRYSM